MDAYAAVVAGMLETVAIVPHTAVLAAAAAAVAVSGSLDRHKALGSWLGQSSKPHLRETWVSTWSKGNNHYN